MSDRLPPPARLEPLAAVVMRFGGAAPDDTASSSAPGWARLPGGRVYGAGHVISPDGTSIITETAADFGSPAGCHWLQRYPHIRPPRPVPGTTAVVAVNLGSRYAHWLLEELPRWLSLPADAADTVITHARATWVHTARALAGFPQNIIPASRHGHHACELLLVPRTPPGPPSRHELDLLTTFATPFFPTTPHTTGRIYLTRRHADRRRVVNEAALSALLEARGFTTVAAENLSWREQIALFAHAREIVAPHGGGLANLAFCRPGTRVIELFHPAYHHTYYSHLARLKALDYHAIVTPAPGADARSGCHPRAGRLDMTVDLPALTALVT